MQKFIFHHVLSLKILQWSLTKGHLDITNLNLSQGNIFTEIILDPVTSPSYPHFIHHKAHWQSPKLVQEE